MARGSGAAPTALSLARNAVATIGDQPLIHYFDTPISARRVDAESGALAAAFERLGVSAGDRVALFLQNIPQFAIAVLAAWKAGAIAVPVNPMLKARELTGILADCTPAVLVAADDLHGTAAEAADAAGVGVVVTTSARDWLDGGTRVPELLPPRTNTGALDLRELIASSAGATRHHDPDPDDPAVLVYTSGTTGPPKGAVISHANFVFGADVYRRAGSLGRDDSCLGLAPLFHVTGLIDHLGICLAVPMPLVLGYRFDAGEALRLIASHRPTFTIAAITAYIALMNDERFAATDVTSLRTVFSGGAPVPPGVVERWRAATGGYVRIGYGLTETSGGVVVVPAGREAPLHPASGLLSVGRAIPGIHVAVVDDEGREVPAGTVGELVVEGPAVVSGYWQRPQESAAAIPGGRLRTGDVAEIDEQGWIYIVDRKKDVINASGFKVWPREVEDVFYEHPAVLEAAVVGVPDDYRGETVKAFVVLRPGHDATAAELVEHGRRLLAAYKYPRLVEVVPELPKTESGKIMRRALRELA